MTGSDEVTVGIAAFGALAGLAAALYARRPGKVAKVHTEQDRWIALREYVKRHRSELARVAAARFREPYLRVAETTLLSTKELLLTAPTPLEEIDIHLDRAAPRPRLPAGRALKWLLPRREGGGRFLSYTAALDAIPRARPRLFSNRLSYRLLRVDGKRWEFGLCHYFEMLDVGEVLASELAVSGLANDIAREPPPWRRLRLSHERLPYRTAVGDPVDFSRRSVTPSINTLTLRRTAEGSATFFLHLRDAEDVAVASGQTHVIPCGGFQPSSAAGLSVKADFDLWLNVMREYAEEFLDQPEATSDVADPLDFVRTEPYLSLQRGRDEGTVRPWVFGLGFDPLTYYVEILTVVVFDADAFDAIFPELVEQNEEGLVIRGSADKRGVPFERADVFEVLNSAALAPAGAACLSLAWQHRHTLGVRVGATQG